MAKNYDIKIIPFCNDVRLYKIIRMNNDDVLII